MVLGELGSLSGMKFPELGFSSDSGGKEIVATATTTAPAAPIIIHQTVPATDGKNQYVTMLVKVAIGGTACWIGYIVFTNALPEYVQEFLPVTRKLFSKTSKFLASSVEKVRVALEEKIGIVSRKQDELGKKIRRNQRFRERFAKRTGRREGGFRQTKGFHGPAGIDSAQFAPDPELHVEGGDAPS